MKSRKIIIPIHSSIHQLQLAYGKRLEQAFTRLGHQVALLNLDAEKNPLYLQAYIEREKADLLVTIDCGGFELELLGDDLFYNSLCIPAMHFLVKPPWELADFLRQRMNFTMEFYTLYEGDKEFIEKYFKRVPKVHVIPELVWENDISDEKEEQSPMDINAGVAVMSDYISSSEVMEQINAFPQVFSAIAMEAIQKRECNQSLSPWKFLEEYLSKIQFQVNSEEFMSLLLPVNLAFSYQEAVEWESAVNSLCSNQIPVHFYGSGWRKLEQKMEDIKQKQYLHIETEHSLNYEEMETICNQYKYILVKDKQERGMSYTPYIQGVWNINGKEIWLPLVSGTGDLIETIKNKNMQINSVHTEEIGQANTWISFLQDELDRIF